MLFSQSGCEASACWHANAPVALAWISYADGYDAHRQDGPYELGFGPFPSDVFHAPFPNPRHGVSTRLRARPAPQLAIEVRVFDEALGLLEQTLKESVSAMA